MPVVNAQDSPPLIHKTTTVDTSALARLPKILLHTHLEGSLPPSTVERLLARHGAVADFPIDPRVIAQRCVTGGWDAFLHMFLQLSACLTTRDDFRDGIFDYAAHLATAHNVVHVEVHCTPHNHLARGIAFDDVWQGLLDGIVAARKEHGIRVTVIFDLLRSRDESAEAILDLIAPLPREHFVALGISGGLDAVPLASYAGICARAASMGLGRVCHAGELAGPESVRTAVETLGVNRISHGVRSLEAPSVLDDAVRRGVHFEVCPSSNAVLGVGPKNHGAVREFLARSVAFSLNTDDELYFDTSPTDEFLKVVACGVLPAPAVVPLQRNALAGAFLSEAQRQALSRRCEPAWRAFVANA